MATATLNGVITGITHKVIVMIRTCYGAKATDTFKSGCNTCVKINGYTNAVAGIIQNIFSATSEFFDTSKGNTSKIQRVVIGNCPSVGSAYAGRQCISAISALNNLNIAEYNITSLT